MAQVRCSLPTPLSVTTELALVALPIAAADAALDDEAHGPGWFSSSWALRRGLEVREGLPSDASLDEWLTINLGREILAPQRAAMRATASPRSITAIA